MFQLNPRIPIEGCNKTLPLQEIVLVVAMAEILLEVLGAAGYVESAPRIDTSFLERMALTMRVLLWYT